MNEKTYLSDYLGTKIKLVINRMTEHGAYLVQEGDYATAIGHDTDNTSRPSFEKKVNSLDEVLLPKGELSPGASAGDSVDVFIYKDSEDRLTATTAQPALTLGEVAVLRVADVTGIGAFLSWGLRKDLFLPFKEQTRRVRPSDEVPVALYVDKSERLCATMHLYDHLKSGSPYEAGDRVNGYIYEIIDRFGAYVAVDNMYSALIPSSGIAVELHVGDEINARVSEITDDGRLTLSLQEKTRKQMRTDADLIYDRLVESGGYLPFHDKTSPEIIKREFHISKAAFKRAIGRLYKTNKITIHEDGIRLHI